jgi:hypothetical protein
MLHGDREAMRRLHAAGAENATYRYYAITGAHAARHRLDLRNPA